MDKAEKKTERADAQRYVLVGTYRKGQLEKWPGLYNYPVTAKDAIDEKDAAKIDELWLFMGTAAQKTYKVEFVGIKTRDELVKEYGYPATGKAHGERYLLFKTEFKYRHKLTPPEEAKKVIVRTADFATTPKVRKQLKAYLESPDRNDPDMAKLLPSIITKLRPEQLRVCEAAVQLEFLFDLNAGIVDKVQKTISEARKKGKLTCVEICAGAGGQAIGLENAGFEHVALVEYESDYASGRISIEVQGAA